jgi:ankyrin repeat protein
MQPAEVVRTLVEGQEVLRRRLPAQRAGVVPLRGRRTELHEAAERGDVAAIEAFADRPEFSNAQDAYGRTPVYCAAWNGKVEAVKAFRAALSGRDDGEGHGRHAGYGRGGQRA